MSIKIKKGKEVFFVRRILFLLYKKQNKRCYYCGKKTNLYPHKKGVKAPDDKATIEHLFSRLDIRRRINKSKVMACYKCNHERGLWDFDRVFNEESYNHYYSDDESDIYQGLLTTLCNSENNKRYLQ